MFPKRRPAAPRTKNTSALRCSFCEKPQEDVRRLIAGPHVFICDECVTVCVDIIGRESERQKEAESLPLEPQPRGAEDLPALTIACALCGTPTPSGDLLRIRERGMLCPGCIGEVEAAAAGARRTKL